MIVFVTNDRVRLGELRELYHGHPDVVVWFGFHPKMGLAIDEVVLDKMTIRSGTEMRVFSDWVENMSLGFQPPPKVSGL